MKGTLAAFDRLNGKEVALLMRDGQAEDLLVDPPEGRIRPGSIFRAKAGRQMKGQGGVFLDTPLGPLFLRQAKGVSPGDTMTVQTGTYAEPGKATPAATKLVFKSRFCLVTPGAGGLNISRSIRDEERRVELREAVSGVRLPDGVGVVLRTAAALADGGEVAEDVAAVLELAARVLSEPETGPPELFLEGPSAHVLAWRDWPVPDSADTQDGSLARLDLMSEIERLTCPRVGLGSEAFMYVEPTRALVAVDVNTGGDASPAAALKANLAAVRDLPRALRLRGLGGQVVVDFAPLAKRDRPQLEAGLRKALKADGIETSLVGWTALGHLELQRKRERLPITESLT